MYSITISILLREFLAWWCPVVFADTFSQGEPRVLGLAMIPGHHVVSIEVEADSLEDAHGFGPSHWHSDGTEPWTFLFLNFFWMLQWTQLQKNSCVTWTSSPAATWKYLDIVVSEVLREGPWQKQRVDDDCNFYVSFFFFLCVNKLYCLSGVTGLLKRNSMKFKAVLQCGKLEFRKELRKNETKQLSLFHFDHWGSWSSGGLWTPRNSNNIWFFQWFNKLERIQFWQHSNWSH